MKTYWRMVRYVRPYLTPLLFSMFFMVIFSVLSSVGIWMISPFLGTLFAADRPAAVATADPAAAGGAGTRLLVPGAGGPVTAASADSVLAATGEVGRALQSKIHNFGALRDRLKAAADGWLMRGSKMEALWRICVVFFFIWLVKNLTGYVQDVLMQYVELRIIKDLRDDLYTKFTSLPLSFYNRHRAGELISRATNDVLIADKCVNSSFTNLVRDPIMIVLYLGLALVISWKLTLIAFGVLPPSLYAIVRIGKLLRRYSHRQQEKMANLTSRLQETISGIRVVKAYAMEGFERGRFLAESERLFRDLFKIQRVQRLSSPLTEQLSSVAGLIILWYGGHQVLTGHELPPDLFILFLVCIFSVIRPIKELSLVNSSLQEGIAAAERIFLVLDAPSEIVGPADAVELAGVRGEVVFERVTFAYNPGEPVLREVDLRVAPGETVALVGSSGSGKSTLVDLIARFYLPQEGRITIDGRDVRDLSLPSLRRAIGMVSQEVILFHDTVRNAIAYGLPGTTQAQIEAAARTANAHEFISQLPQGYDTVIGDRGLKLSGGQRQRLAIARAVLRDPPILVLDEATSALDTESELLVQEAIERVVRNRTTIVVAHRLSTIQNADRIYVLKEGRVVQSGSHAQLLAQGGPYKVLYELQFRA